jgi:hypothetical protein
VGGLLIADAAWLSRPGRPASGRPRPTRSLTVAITRPRRAPHPPAPPPPSRRL